MKKIRLIETFAGYGSQAMALDRLNLDYEHYKISEWNVLANKSYNVIHNKDKTDYSKNLTDDEVYKNLEELEISINDKNILNKKQLKRKGIVWCRQIYNEYKQNNNLGNITHIKAKDLQIKDIDKYLYLFTYSFPCTSISTAGKQEGMKKGSGTTSGLLWEIERIFKEIINEHLQLPQILFMENVKQVISKRNKNDFDDWCNFLESIGYTNSYAILNSSEYGGIPQNRERCYMISILGNKKYEFPDKIPLTKYLRDFLDKGIISEKQYINNPYSINTINKYKNYNFFNETKRYKTIMVLGNYMKSNYDSSRIVDINGICPTVKENHNTVTAIIDNTHQVRKLTVTEFGRLMGVNEEDIIKILSVQSDSNARKQFGNSIVVDVMVNIFKKLFEQIL